MHSSCKRDSRKKKLRIIPGWKETSGTAHTVGELRKRGDDWTGRKVLQVTMKNEVLD